MSLVMTSSVEISLETSHLEALVFLVSRDVVFRGVVEGRGANAVPVVLALAGATGLLLLELAVHRAGMER